MGLLQCSIEWTNSRQPSDLGGKTISTSWGFVLFGHPALIAEAVFLLKVPYYPKTCLAFLQPVGGSSQVITS